MDEQELDFYLSQVMREIGNPADTSIDDWPDLPEEMLREQAA